jgi:hypothetical protein
MVRLAKVTYDIGVSSSVKLLERPVVRVDGDIVGLNYKPIPTIQEQNESNSLVNLTTLEFFSIISNSAERSLCREK